MGTEEFMPTSTDRRPATKSKADQGGATTRTQAAFTLAAAAFLAALTGCVDPGARSTYYGPVPAGEEVVYGNPDSSRAGLTISVESDFYGPLEPYGEWMEIDGYGR